MDVPLCRLAARWPYCQSGSSSKRVLRDDGEAILFSSLSHIPDDAKANMPCCVTQVRWPRGPTVDYVNIVSPDSNWLDLICLG